VEFLGGIALILGLATRWASLLLAINMVGAIYFVHWKNGFYSNHGGYEFALSLLAACLALALSGAGALAMDSLI
jgi:putative oxidoreductase